MTKLSEIDILNLSKNPTIENKSSIVKNITIYYNGGEITEKGLRLAEDIFRIMVEDVEVKVRQILSESLKNCKGIPKDIVNKLVNDENSVSIPFIQSYQSLTNQDLINIINSQNFEKQKAVANRKDISEDISQYIVDKCPEEIVGILIDNETASIVEKTFHTIVNKYNKSEKIQTKLVYRNELPVSIIERIVHNVSDELQKQLVTRHNLPSNLACDIVEQVKEKATLKISEDYSSDKQIKELVTQLNDANRLTPSLVVRSICMGDLKFFEYALSSLTNTPLNEVSKILINTEVDFMIRNLLRKASIPKTMFPAVFSALTVIKEMRFDFKTNSRKSFSHKVIERILSVEAASEELSEQDAKYLISKIS